MTAHAPGPLRALLGVTIDGNDPLGSTALGAQPVTNPVRFTVQAPVNGTLAGTLWADLISAETAHVLGVFTEQWYAGRPAVTVNHIGKGSAWYVGTQFGDEFWTPFLRSLCETASVPMAPPHLTGIEVVRRTGARMYTFVTNHTTTQGWIELAQPFRDLLTGEVLPAGRSTLAPLGGAHPGGRAYAATSTRTRVSHRHSDFHDRRDAHVLGARLSLSLWQGTERRGDRDIKGHRKACSRLSILSSA